MTTAVLAANYLEAREVAQAWGLKPHEWLYPNHPDELRGHRITSTIRAEGWEHSRLPVEALEQVRYRLSPDATEVDAAGRLPDRYERAQAATATLEAERRRRHPRATSVDLSNTPTRRRRRTRWQRFTAWVRSVFSWA